MIVVNRLVKEETPARMDKPRIESTLLPIFTVLAIISLTALSAGCFLPYWIGTERIHYGLWYARSCVSSPCVDVWYSEFAELSPQQESWKLSRMFETVGLGFGVMSLFSGVIMCVLRQKSRNVRSVTQGVFFATSLLAGLLALIGVLIFISHWKRSQMMWGVALPAVAGLLFMFTGVFALVVCRYDPKYNPEDHYTTGYAYY